MKKLLISLIIIIITTTSAVAADVTFLWNQDVSGMEAGGSSGWKLKRSLTVGGPYTVYQTVFYDGVARPEYSKAIAAAEILGVYYWVVSAFNRYTESSNSNEVITTIISPATPVSLRLSIQ